uniref:Uncharacterized protein n=1 Tax=Anguilla anguilla TaxID=7936 RepID=A0A0E9T9H7_ANGAN
MLFIFLKAEGNSDPVLWRGHTEP